MASNLRLISVMEICRLHLKKTGWCVVLFLAVMGWGCASEQPPAGKALFEKNCSSCHGIEGRGDGIVADSLTPRPPDLTLLRKSNQGSYPLNEVMRAIDGTRTIRAHGSSQMPIWGEVFAQELKDSPHSAQTALRRVQAIAEYVGDLQRE